MRIIHSSNNDLTFPFEGVLRSFIISLILVLKKHPACTPLFMSSYRKYSGWFLELSSTLSAIIKKLPYAAVGRPSVCTGSGDFQESRLIKPHRLPFRVKAWFPSSKDSFLMTFSFGKWPCTLERFASYSTMKSGWMSSREGPAGS